MSSPYPGVPAHDDETGAVDDPAAGKVVTDDGEVVAAPTSTDAYPNVGEWVQEWFAPTIAVRLAGGDTGRGLTWCAQWWAHPGVAARLHALWQAWETARLSQDAAALSSWWTSHADHHLRALLDGEHGPMWRCSPTQHRPIPALPVASPPDGWFNSPASSS